MVILTGRLVSSPELKYTQQGIAFAKITLAVQRNKQEADFITCIAWDKVAEQIGEYTKKGSKVALQGRLEVRTYEDFTHQKRRICEVIISRIEFLESKTASQEVLQSISLEDHAFPF